MSQGMIPPSGRSDGSIPPGSGGAYATGSSPRGGSSFLDSSPTDNTAIPVMGTDGMARAGRYVKGDPRNEQLDMPMGVQEYNKKITPKPQQEIADARTRDTGIPNHYGIPNKVKSGANSGAPPDPLQDSRQKKTMLRMLASPDMGNDGMARTDRFSLHNKQSSIPDIVGGKELKALGLPTGVSNRTVPPMLQAIQQLTGGNGQPQAQPTMPSDQDTEQLPTVVTSPPSPQSTANMTAPTGLPMGQMPSNIPPPVVSSGSPILDAISSVKKTLGF